MHSVFICRYMGSLWSAIFTLFECNFSPNCHPKCVYFWHSKGEETVLKWLLLTLVVCKHIGHPSQLCIHFSIHIYPFVLNCISIWARLKHINLNFYKQLQMQYHLNGNFLIYNCTYWKARYFVPQSPG